MKRFESLAGWLLVLGGITLGLDGLLNYALLDSVLGVGSAAVRILNIAIGVAAIMMAYKMANDKKK